MLFVGLFFCGVAEVVFLAVIILALIQCFSREKEKREYAIVELKKSVPKFIIISAILGICIFGIYLISSQMFEVRTKTNEFEITSSDGGTYYYKVGDGNKYMAINATDNNVCIGVQPNSKPVVREIMISKKSDMNEVLYYILTIGMFDGKRIEYEIMLPNEP